MTSAVPWGAIPQTEALAQAAGNAVDKLEGYRAQDNDEKQSLGSRKGISTSSSELERVKSDREVTELARQLTHQRSIKDIEGTYINPFAGSDDPALDPHSGQFKPESWIRTLIGLQSRDPERYPRRVAGVAYRNLNVHGFGSLTDYQKQVTSQVVSP